MSQRTSWAPPMRCTCHRAEISWLNRVIETPGRSKHDVIVVGGGPAGLRAAALLSARGWDVAVFEEHHEPGQPVHCTGVLATEAYDELDIPQSPRLNSLSTVQFFAPSGATIGYTTPEVEALVIDRRLLDHELHKSALQAGVRVVTGARVTNVAPTASGVTVSVQDAPDAHARACILASGASYVFQRRLGMGLPSAFLQSAQVECDAQALETVEVHFGHEVAPRGFAWVVPVRRGEWTAARIGLMCEGNAARHFATFVARVAGRWGLDRGSVTDVTSAPRLKMLPLAPLRRTYADRTIAVGDAAGLVKATTGGGIYYSLISAAMAAEVLDTGLERDSLAARNLAPYERMWRKRLGPELDAQLSLRRLADRFGDKEIDALFELAQTDGIMPIVRRTARFNRHRDLILALFRHPPARRIFFRRLQGKREVAAL